MRHWMQAGSGVICGGCYPPKHLVADDPVLVIRLPGVTRAKYRCALCAGEPVPAEVPAAMPMRTSAAPLSMTKLADLIGADFKRKAAGDSVE